MLSYVVSLIFTAIIIVNILSLSTILWEDYPIAKTIHGVFTFPLNIGWVGLLVWINVYHTPLSLMKKIEKGEIDYTVIILFVVALLALIGYNLITHHK